MFNKWKRDEDITTQHGTKIKRAVSQGAEALPAAREAVDWTEVALGGAAGNCS